MVSSAINSVYFVSYLFTTATRVMIFSEPDHFVPHLTSTLPFPCLEPLNILTLTLELIFRLRHSQLFR